MKKEDLSFLGAVARAYAGKYEEMTDFCFVFPNKRSGTFFLKNLSECLGSRSMLAPDVMDVATFMSRVSGREVASRIDMVFRLYKVYCGLIGRVDSLRTEADLLEFDRFAPWAETLIGDFSEVDQYDVDAAALFKNVRDYRSIASNFLTEEQIEVIERYFGYRPAVENVEQFWKSVGDQDDMSRLKEKFVELWKILPELYSGLTENLEADGLAMPGTTFRRALREVEARGREALPWERVVVVGFNLLSTSEASLFAQMRDMKGDDGEPYAEFFWDAAGPVLGAGSRSRGAAARGMRRNIRNFPMPAWALPEISRSDRDRMPSLTVAAAPSNVAQAKIAAITVRDWMKSVGREEIAGARTAIVIPDENLLMPLLHSLPEDLGSVNLTMGYSMRYTSVTSFIYHLRRLQARRCKTGGRAGYFHEDLRLFLAHPLVHVVIGTDVANHIQGEMGMTHLRVVTPEWLSDYSPELARMLTPIDAGAGVEATIDYIDGVLQKVDEALSRDSQQLRTVNSKIERSQIAVYRLAMSRLQHSVNHHGIVMRWQSVFHLVDRMVAGETVTFEGEPLEGLQVMGLLETRAIDFDHLVILSMNDKVMPRRSRRRTFVADTLRRGYGLPVSSQGEELYAYYFYRLISRARNVTLVYDARAGEGMRSGGKSRFLMQLDMLYARDAVDKVSYTFMLDKKESEASGVAKTDKVMEMLELFRKKENGRNLSASALMNYCKCPVKFYYKNVVQVNDDAKPANFIDAITQGNIVHRSMELLYFPDGSNKKYLKGDSRRVLTAADLGRMLEDRAATERIVVRAVNEEHYHLPEEKLDRPLYGTVRMVAERLMRQVEDVMRHDMTLAPLELIGGELRGRTRLKLGGAPEVNVSYAFDRVDLVGGNLRIVDYKTGSSHVKAKEFAEIFNGSYDAYYMLQLLLYSHLLEGRVEEEENRRPGRIEMHIYDVNTVAESGSVQPTVENRTIGWDSEIGAMFLAELERVIRDIFDRSKPFGIPATDDNCVYCAYKALCGKE